MTGIDATGAIREWERSVDQRPTPIVAITANAMMEDRRRYLDVGMNDCLVKPFTKQQLFDVLATQLASNGSAGRRATQR